MSDKRKQNKINENEQKYNKFRARYNNERKNILRGSEF